MIDRWRALPHWTRWILAVYVLGFLEGSIAHLADLARGGFHAYASFAPVPLQVFFVCLVVLDPLVVALVALVRPWGVRLACAVMTLDVTANWISNWPQLHTDPTSLLRPCGLLPITLFGLFVLGTAAPVLRALNSSRQPTAAPRG